MTRFCLRPTAALLAGAMLLAASPGHAVFDKIELSPRARALSGAYAGLSDEAAGIFYNPATTAQGEYRVSSEIYLFPGERREGYGIFIGGAELEGDNQSYVYFLIRKDGRFIIKRRNGSEAPTITPWTEHPAIVKQAGDENAKNVLAVDVGTESLSFYVNDQMVTTVPRSQLPTDGIVGLRVNHALNLHIANLEIEQE